MPVRGSDGLCIECGPMKWARRWGYPNARAATEGYTNRKQRQKMLRDVFAGDLVSHRRSDAARHHSYFYFVDHRHACGRARMSPPAKWARLAAVPGILEANVYGVTVPEAAPAWRPW